MKDTSILTNNGINVQASLDLLGDMEMYDETLGDFLDMTDDKISALENHLQANDMPNYAIDIHALKSDSKYLGFAILADLSYESEMKAKAGDSVFVAENHSKILQEAKRVINLCQQYMGREITQVIPEGAGTVQSVEPVAAQPEAVVQPEMVVQPQVAVQPEAVVQPEMVVQPQVAVQPEMSVQPEMVAQPQVAVQPEMSVQPEMVVQPQVAVQPEMSVQPEMVAQPQVAVQPEMGVQPEMVAQPQVTVQPEMSVQSEMVAQPQVTVQPEMSVQPEMVAQPQVTVQPEMSVQPEMVAQPQVEVQAAVVEQPVSANTIQFFPADNYGGDPMSQALYMQQSQSIPQPAPVKKGIILVVDDSPLVSNFVKKIFSVNYDVLIASDGQKAIDIINDENVRKQIKTCLLDLNMPNVNGFDVMDYFKEKGFFVRTPVAIISGAEDEMSLDKAKAYPIVDVLPKPFNERDVQRVVEKCLAVYF